MRVSVVILFFFISHFLHAVNYSDKSFYLIDSLDITELSSTDRQLLDSCLSIYHQSKHDTVKINSLEHICENLYHDVWKIYQRIQHEKIKVLLKQIKKGEESIDIKKKYARSLNNIAMIYQNKGELDSAQVYFKRSLKFRLEIDDDYGIAESYNNRAYTYELLGDIPTSIMYYEKSLEKYRELQDAAGIALVHLNIGAIYSSLSEVDMALGYYREGLKLYESINDKNGISRALNNIGIIYRTHGDLPKAIDYYKKSLRIVEELGNKKGVAIRLQNIAIVFSEMGQNDKALQNLYRSLDLNKEINHKYSIAKTHTEIGNILISQKNYKEALVHIEEGLQLSNRLNYKEGQSETTVAMAQIYLELGNLNLSKRYALRGLTLSKELGFPQNISKAARILSEVHELSGEGMAALGMYRTYIIMKDSVKNEETLKQLVTQESRFKLKQKSQELIIANKEKKLKTTQLRLSIILYSLGLLVIIISGVVLFRLRTRRYEIELNELRTLKQELNERKMNKKITSVPVTFGKKIVPIPPSDIAFFNTLNRHVLLNHKTGKSYVVDFTISTLEKHLPEQFIRVHRSYIINTEEISEITRTYKGKVVFTIKGKGEKKVPSSLSYSSGVRDFIENFKSKSYV